MENINDLNQNQIIHVGYDKKYAIAIVILAILLILFNTLGTIGIICALVFIIAGIMALTGRKHFSYDLNNKIIILYAAVGPATKKYMYDRIFLDGNKVMLEKDGKLIKVWISKMISDKKSYEVFIKDITTNK
jgi:hypothetical protein